MSEQPSFFSELKEIEKLLEVINCTSDDCSHDHSGEVK